MVTLKTLVANQIVRKKWNDIAVKYVVYRFDKGEHINTEDASKIVAITPRTFYKLPYNFFIFVWVLLKSR